MFKLRQSEISRLKIKSLPDRFQKPVQNIIERLAEELPGLDDNAELQELRKNRRNLVNEAIANLMNDFHTILSNETVTVIHDARKMFQENPPASRTELDSRSWVERMSPVILSTLEKARKLKINTVEWHSKLKEIEEKEDYKAFLDHHSRLWPLFLHALSQVESPLDIYAHESLRPIKNR